MRKRAVSKREAKINVFYKFLIDNDAFVEYRENVRACKWNTLVKMFNRDIRTWFSAAFTWVTSPEGSDYWCDLAIKWDNYRKEKGIED